MSEKVYEVGEQVFIIDREEVGTVLEVEHITDYVLDDASFEAPKLPSYRLVISGGEVWRKASEIRAVPEEIASCVVEQVSPLGDDA